MGLGADIRCRLLRAALPAALLRLLRLGLATLLCLLRLPSAGPRTLVSARTLYRPPFRSRCLVLATLKQHSEPLAQHLVPCPYRKCHPVGDGHCRRSRGQRIVPRSAGTLPTSNGLFVGFLAAVILIERSRTTI